jgi:hypothetical protein
MEIKPIPPQEPNKQPPPKKEIHPTIPALMEQLSQLFRDILHQSDDKDIKKH